MSGATAPKFLNQAEFARRRKVSRKSVTTWKSKGLLVLNEAGQVDVEATEWKLDERPPKYRGGVTHRPVRAADGNRVSPAPRVALEAAKVTPESDTLEEEEAEISPENLPMAEAVRRKENFLGLLRKHEFEVGQKEWVRVEDVGQLVERDYATVRERMLVMPGKMASRLVGLRPKPKLNACFDRKRPKRSMNCMTRTALLEASPLAMRLRRARRVLKPPPILNVIEWADRYRKVASKTSASPGQWRTGAQPVAFGPMQAVTEPDTDTISVMAATQILKTELLTNVAGYFIHQDPGSILFVQPTQGSAEAFSKERFQPTVDATPVLSALIPRPRAKGSENTIAHKGYPGGSCDFVGANAPGDLASRPKRIGLFDEIDKYPTSAGDEGDPVALGEERLSTFRSVGRSKSVRTCSPTEEDTSRIGREYKASDQRRCFVACPHCGFRQTLTWASVVWSKNEVGENLPDTAGIQCGGPDCGTIWTERERLSALAGLEHLSDYGWRQTKGFTCCAERQEPELWDTKGRSLCRQCGERSRYEGHAGFHASKLLSSRHRLPDLVREFLSSKDDAELFKKFTNTGLAELWRPEGRESFKNEGLIARAENYGPNDLPESVKVITGFADVQGDRLEVQLIGWGADEECWPFHYEVIAADPAQPHAWQELDALRRREFLTVSGRVLRIAAFGIDTGGNHTAQVYAYCRARLGQRVFGTKGVAGKRPIWPIQASRSKTNDKLWIVGVDSAKDAIFGRLKIQPPAEGQRKPGFIHFPVLENFGPDYFEQLTQSERRELRKRMGQPYTVWVPVAGKRNEVLDTFVGALAVRRSLPRWIEAGLEYSRVPPPTSAPEGEQIVVRPKRVANFARPLAQASDPYL